MKKNTDGLLLSVVIERRQNIRVHAIYYPTVYTKKSIKLIKYSPFNATFQSRNETKIQRKYSVNIKKKHWDTKEQSNKLEEDIYNIEATTAYTSLVWFNFGGNV